MDRDLTHLVQVADSGVGETTAHAWYAPGSAGSDLQHPKVACPRCASDTPITAHEATPFTSVILASISAQSCDNPNAPMLADEDFISGNIHTNFMARFLSRLVDDRTLGSATGLRR